MYALKWHGYTATKSWLTQSLGLIISYSGVFSLENLFHSIHWNFERFTVTLFSSKYPFYQFESIFQSQFHSKKKKNIIKCFKFINLLKMCKISMNHLPLYSLVVKCNLVIDIGFCSWVKPTTRKLLLKLNEVSISVNH